MPDDLDAADSGLNTQMTSWGESAQDRVLRRLIDFAKLGRVRDQALRDRVKALEDRVAALEVPQP